MSGANSQTDTQSALSEFILDTLHQFPLGLSEYDLIKHIQATGNLHFKDVSLWDKLSLFNTHFILFHTLYKLKDNLWQKSQYILDISPLKIVLYKNTDEQPAVSTQLTEHDPLRDFYLDLNNLKDTTEEDVENLLSSFWTRLAANEQRGSALQILELEDPVDFIVIKKQYRKLAMQHHPDRGGDKAKLQRLNYAMTILEKSQPKPKLE